MENEEKAKVILDYDKYQELLAKANLNENAIQEIKDVAFKEGYDKGYRLGNSLCQLKLRQTYLGLLKNLNGCFDVVPAYSLFGVCSFYANSFFQENIKSHVMNSFCSLLEEKRLGNYEDRVNQLSGQNCSQAACM
jgi:hypothetical protein